MQNRGCFITTDRCRMKNLSIFINKICAKLLVLGFDLFAIPLAWYLAYWLQYNLRKFPHKFASRESLTALVVLFFLQTTCYYYYKVYRGLWKFCSLSDVSRIIRAVATAIILVIPALYMTGLVAYIPRSILPLYGILLVTLLCGARLSFRLQSDRRYKGIAGHDTQRVLVVGAGIAGEGLIRDLKRTHYVPLGLVDDDSSKRGQDVRGVLVLGNIDELPRLAESHRADLIFIAIPSANSAQMRHIVNQCEQCKIPFRTLPTIQALAAGRVEVNALREVRLDDLLGRDQVELAWDKITQELHGKRVLVTGAGGSIGSELCRQILSLNPTSLVLLDHSEFNLYKIELELRESFPSIRINIALANVVDRIAIKHVFKQFKPEIVFHAAAYKHVPLLENQVRAAVLNNVIGTQTVAEASVAHLVDKFVLISSDKAVNPTNIMGSTKRIAEIYCQNFDLQAKTKFITVRFGNVLGSVGSVVPLFKNQLQRGGPLTVTHPDMQRYFMTISEACRLILQATVNGQGGEIFVLDMGEPIKISYLAEQMIRLAGFEPGVDIHIEYTGLRPGEKLFEELFHTSEQLVETQHEKLFQAKFRKINWNELSEAFSMLNSACALYQSDEILVVLKNLVPEFSGTLNRDTIECTIAS
jgi:FlaA1/EpsC-like NDP-sugar epimerase